MDVDTKDKEIIFLRNKVDQLKMQVSILQKGINKRQKKLRSLRTRLGFHVGLTHGKSLKTSNIEA